MGRERLKGEKSKRYEGGKVAAPRCEGLKVRKQEVTGDGI